MTEGRYNKTSDIGGNVNVKSALSYHQQSGRVRLAREALKAAAKKFEDVCSAYGVGKMSRRAARSQTDAEIALGTEQEKLREIVGQDELNREQRRLTLAIHFVESKNGKRNARAELTEFLTHFGCQRVIYRIPRAFADYTSELSVEI
jgi:hypothetical protein